MLSIGLALALLVPRLAQDPVPVDAGVPPAALVERARDAACVVSAVGTRVPDTTSAKDRAMRRVQPGLLVGEGGHVLTSYAALYPAKDIQVEFPEPRSTSGARSARPRGEAADLVAFDADLDLALLRLKRGAPRVPLAVGAAKAAAPAGGTEPARSGEAAPSDAERAGSASERARAHVLLSDDARADASTWTIVDPRAFALVPTGELVEVGAQGSRLRDTPRALRLGGHAILRADGSLGGLWRWQPAGASAAPQWIDGARLAAFVKSNLGAKVVVAKDCAPPRVHAALPEMVADVDANADPLSKIDPDSTKLRDDIDCTRCEGRGWDVIEEYREDWIRFGRPLDIQKRDASKVEDCRTCRASRLEKDKVVRNRLREYATHFAHVREKDVERARTKLRLAIDDVSGTNPVRVREIVNEHARDMLAKQAAGRVVLLGLPRDEWAAFERPSWDASARVVRTTEFGWLLLSGPALACEVPPGYRAFVVGVVAGRVTAGGDELACLVGCYVVPILDSLPRTD